MMDHGSFVLLMLAPGRQSSSCINANVGDARDHECICNAMQCELVLGCRCHLIASPSWERGRQTDASRQPCSYRAVLQIIRWGHGTCPVSLHPIACYSLLSLGRSTKAKGLGVPSVSDCQQWVGRVDIGDGLSFLTLCHLINNRLRKTQFQKKKD